MQKFFEEKCLKGLESEELHPEEICTVKLIVFDQQMHDNRFSFSCKILSQMTPCRSLLICKNNPFKFLVGWFGV